MKQTITLTFSEAVENHAGMQIITTGEETNGFKNSTLQYLVQKYGGEYVDLDEHLSILHTEDVPNVGVAIFRNGIQKLLNIDPEQFYQEQATLPVDTKFFHYGKVANKKARYNLCFADFSQEPDYMNKKGTIIDFEDERVPLLNLARQRLHEVFGKEFNQLLAEGNYYYDPKKCYIGFHGDTERKKVVGLRLGSSFPLHYQWYQNGSAISDIITIPLNGGDIYIMDEKATGNDWKKRKILTLRHAAGDLNVLSK